MSVCNTCHGGGTGPNGFGVCRSCGGSGEQPPTMSVDPNDGPYWYEAYLEQSEDMRKLMAEHKANVAAYNDARAGYLHFMVWGIVIDCTLLLLAVRLIIWG